MEEDRETNLLACEASLCIKNHSNGNGQKLKITKVNAVNPEAYFNRSIVHVGNADLKKAEKSCNNAKNEYEAYDDLEADELEQELAPIQAQLALIYQLQGEKGKSLGMYQKVLNSQPDLILTSIVRVKKGRFLIAHGWTRLFTLSYFKPVLRFFSLFSLFRLLKTN